MSKLDLLLIHPNSRAGYQGLAYDLTAIETPVWAGMLATYCRLKGHSVKIIDAEACEMEPQRVADAVEAADPLLTCVVAYGHQPSASTQVMPAAGATVRAITLANPLRRTILLGGHVSALPVRTAQEEQAQFVCTGEGPITLHELILACRGGQREDFVRVRGLAWREAGRIHRTPDAPLVEDLDREMPCPAYDLLPMHLYRAHNWHAFGTKRQPYASLYTTLGCPYACSFCCIQAPFKVETINSYRCWSPAQVAANLSHLRKHYGITNIKIADEMFVLNPRHVTGVCNEIFKAGLTDLNLWAYARVDTVRDDAQVEVLRAAGFRWLALGIEAADAGVRESSLKAFGQERITTTLARLKKAGIHTIANYIFGLPGDTQATMQATLDLAISLNTEFGNFYSAMAYPGSALYSQALATTPERLPSSWSGYSQHSKDSRPLGTATLSSEQVRDFRDKAFLAYFDRPEYLSMVERIFGRDGVKQVRRMLAAKLERGAA